MILSRQNIPRHLLGAIIVALFLLHSLELIQIPYLSTLENQLYDARIRYYATNDLDERIVIVDIDEKSLRQQGRWPWNRKQVAQMTDKLLNEYKVAVLAYDVLFAEEDSSSGLDLLEDLSKNSLSKDRSFLKQFRKLRPQLEYDRILADSMRDMPVVLGYYFKNSTSLGEQDLLLGQLPPPSLVESSVDVEKIPFNRASGYGANLPILQSAALAGGFIDIPTIADDGIIRKVPLLQYHEGLLYDSFALSILRTILGFPPVELVVESGYEHAAVNMGLEWLKVDGFRIPVDHQGNILIPYRGKFPSFPYISAADIFSGTAPLNALENKIVLVGTTSAGLLDMRSTPVQNVYPGVEVHASVVSGILDGTVKHQPGYVKAINLIFITLLAIGLQLLLPKLSAIKTLIAIVSISASITLFNYYAWQNLNLNLALGSQLVMILSQLIFHLAYGFLVEDRNKRFITRLFGQYVPPELVEEISKRPDEFDLSGETRDMSVMFTDIRSFTRLAEDKPPQFITQILNEYFTLMTETIHQQRGTIDKYIGDAIMAFWGAPLRDEHHAQHAILASLNMIKALPELNRNNERKGWPRIDIGIGVNTGPMNVGNMGSKFRMSYTVMGDSVNLASRLEQLTKKYQVPIITTEDSSSQCSDIIFLELDMVRVMGKNRPVKILQPLGLIDEIPRTKQDEIRRFHDVLEMYRQKQWSEALEAIQTLIADFGASVLYQEYLGRIIHFSRKPPDEQWDGVYTFHSK